MRNIIIVLVIALLASCASPEAMVYSGEYGVKNKTKVNISEGNFSTLGSFSGTARQTLNKKFDYSGLIADARKALWANVRKSGINVNSCVVLHNTNLEMINDGSETVATITAEVVSFDKNAKAGKVNYGSYQNYNNSKNKSSSASKTREENNEEVEEKPKKKGGSFLDKISGAFDKKEETPETEEETPKVEEKTQAEPTKVEEYTNCTTCKGAGKINIQCTSKVCSKGKIYATCSHCSGNYKNANAQCPKCQGTGCDYCDYDGKACPNCNQGQETKTHSQCNGTGILKAVCHKCNGSGKILK